MSIIYINPFQFAAPAGPTDPYFANVSLLLHGDGVNGGNNTTFVDSSTNNHAITVYGNTQQVGVSPFGSGGSGAFDGSGDYLSASASAFNPGTGDFTIEWWQKLPTTNTNYSQLRFNNNGGIKASNGAVQFYSQSPGINCAGSTSFTTDWEHIAVVRSSGVISFYHRGVYVPLNLVNSGPSTSISADRFEIGNSFSSYVQHNGYIDEFRVTVGVARYTSNFTPPTAPLTADANTSLLLHFDNVDIIDSSSTPKAITAFGNAQISTAQSKFGGSSIVFDNAGDYLTPASSADLILGSTWTVECWWYLNAAGSGTTRNALLLSGSLGASGSLGIYQEAGAFLNVRAGAATSDVRSSNSSIVALEWQHIAISTLDNVATIYINGVQNGSGPINGPVTASVSRIGSVGIIDYDTNGYIDDFRITKGVARYTSNFTPPTAPFPDA